MRLKLKNLYYKTQNLKQADLTIKNKPINKNQSISNNCKIGIFKRIKIQLKELNKKLVLTLIYPNRSRKQNTKLEVEKIR